MTQSNWRTAANGACLLAMKRAITHRLCIRERNEPRQKTYGHFVACCPPAIPVFPLRSLTCTSTPPNEFWRQRFPLQAPTTSQPTPHPDRPCCLQQMHLNQTCLSVLGHMACCRAGSGCKYAASGTYRRQVRRVRVPTVVRHQMYWEPAPMSSRPLLLSCKIAPAWRGLVEMKDLDLCIGRPYGQIGAYGGLPEEQILIVQSHGRGEFMSKFQATESRHL